MFDTGLLIICVVIFVAIVLGMEGLYLWWNSSRGPEARRIERRLAALSGGGREDEELALLKRRVLSQSPALARLLLKIPHIEVVDKMLVQAGLSISVGDLLIRSLLFAVVGAIFAVWMHGAALTVLLIALLLGALPLMYVQRRRVKRLAAFDDRLAGAIDLMARALRAGHALPTALQMVGNEVAEPVGLEFRALFDEINYGVPMSEAMLNMVERMPSTDLKYFVVAVLIQRETGGNLAELLDNISTIIRERVKLMGKVRTLAAEGKMSAWILGLLPFAAALLMYLASPAFLEVLWTDPIGPKMIAYALILMVLGVIWMRSIIRIRV